MCITLSRSTESALPGSTTCDMHASHGYQRRSVPCLRFDEENHILSTSISLGPLRVGHLLLCCRA